MHNNSNRTTRRSRRRRIGAMKSISSYREYLIVAFLLMLVRVGAQRKTFNVIDYGAKPDGKTDNTQEFEKAWMAACRSDGRKLSNVIVIPSGTFLLGPVVFKGPCTGPIAFIIDGILRAHSDKASSLGIDHWMSFQYLDHFTIDGRGLLDGQGPSAWPYNTCSTDPNCPKLPITICLAFVNNARISSITSRDSKSFHFSIYRCSNLWFDRLKIQAPADSPNTDGIHIGMSDNIQIHGSRFSTGDDCISIGPGSQNINISYVNCGPGHGISIGSLGGSPDEEEVNGITVQHIDLTATLNGVRIKTWPKPYQTLVTNVTFQHINVSNVANPIIIDQQYCPTGRGCSRQASWSRISDVRFRNIQGTSQTQVAVSLQCSQVQPCGQIELRDIDLALQGGGGEVTSSCTNAHGVAYGIQKPRPCIA